MDAGFSSLTRLKELVLPLELRSDAQWDEDLASIGRGVVRRFAQHCNRQWPYTVGSVYQTSAEREYVVVPHLPLVAVTALARSTCLVAGAQSWEALDLEDEIRAITPSCGIVEFGRVMGSYSASIRVTYTGGYWWDTTEDGTGTMPELATALPDDLAEAWVAQCQAIIRQRAILTTNSAPDLTAKEAGKRVDADAEFLPGVLAVINSYRRFTS